jgi:hypothetical protein
MKCYLQLRKLSKLSAYTTQLPQKETVSQNQSLPLRRRWRHPPRSQLKIDVFLSYHKKIIHES